jgi:dipeptidyl aminopeptidase/acylaminoacyl peptidase
MRRLLGGLVVGAAIGISLVAGATGTHGAPAATPPSGAAVFSSDLGIYVTNLDGTALKRLTRDGYDAGPVWSPDAKRIAFSRAVGWSVAVMVMNADGAGSRRVGWGERPAWSPDSTRIVFVDGPGVEDVSSGKTMVSAPAGFTIARLDGSGTRRVGVGEVFGVSWSPDGKRIAFTVRRDDWIHLYRLATGKARTLARIPGGTHDLAWSPDGTQIAVSDDKGIELVDVSTSRVSKLTGEGSGPRWSPDGTRIAFNRGDPASDVAQLLTIGRDGRGQRQVVAKMSGYSWAGDGGLLFTRPRSVGEGADIWWVRSDGGGAKPITHAFPTGASFGEPQWAATAITARRAAPVAAISLEPSHVLATRSPVLALAADGRRVAFETRCSGGPLAILDAAGRSERVVGTSCDSEHGRRELAVAGNRSAWITDNYSMIASWLEVAAPGAKRITIDYADEKADGGAIGNLTGEGELLVYNTWGTGGGYEPKKFVPTLWRVVGTTKKQVVSGADAFAVVDVDAGRIAVLRDDGRLVILDRLGNRLSAFPLGKKGMQPEQSIDRWPVRLAGRLIVALRGTTIEVRDATSGALRHRWAAVRSEAPITLEDARGNFAVYEAGIALHVLRLSDGQDRMLDLATAEGPVHAELERDGLYYSYNTPAGAKRGRVVFVPLHEVTASFG